MKNLRMQMTALVLLLAVNVRAPAEVSFEFVNQELQEIVYVLSCESGIPIVCDDTVTGRGNFRYSGTSFDVAFSSFLQLNRLYVSKDDDCWHVSRMRIIPGNESGLFSVDACDTPPARIFEEVSRICGVSVVHDVLPATPVSLHADGVSAGAAVALVMRNFSGYEVTADGNLVSVEKVALQPSYTTSVQAGQRVDIHGEDGLYQAELTGASFLSAIDALAAEAGIEYCSLVKSESAVARCVFRDRCLEDALTLICAQASADWTYIDDLYVFYSAGSAGRQLEEQLNSWHFFDLRFITSQEALSVLRTRFPDLAPSAMTDTVLMAECTDGQASAVSAFLEKCDCMPVSHVVTLRYISTEYFLAHLPPGMTRSQFTDAGRGNTLFFSGSEAAMAELQDALSVIDVPAERISYDLLIVQVQKSSSLNWDVSLKASPATPGTYSGLQASVSPFSLFNIDLVGAFGYSFAANLQAAIADNKADIYADTVLHGISGSPISFRNTNTYRYRDPYVDTDTGKKTGSGVTREIVSGLVLEVTGWVSGDGMISTSVKASISRQGADVSSSGNPPPTTEKLVTTEVRGRSGEVIVLSGLVQDDTTTVEERTPLISRIPLLGWLFKQQEKIEEKNEMFIYLVPHLEGAEEVAE